MKTARNFAAVLVLSTLLGVTNPITAQTINDTSSTTKPNGSGAGNGASQGAPDAGTVSGTGTGTLAGSGSVASGDSGVKKSTAVENKNEPTSDNSHNNWGLLGLVGLLGLLGFKSNRERAS